MAVALAPSPTPSAYILRETRRLLLAGWLRDGKSVVPAGERDGFELYDVRSRRAGHAPHRTGVNRVTGDHFCTDCEGHQHAGMCSHVLLVLCMNGAVWDALMFPAPGEEVA